MLYFLDACPLALLEGGPWDSIYAMSADGRTQYGVAGIRKAGDAVQLCVKFEGVRPSWYKSFRDFDLPALKRMIRMCYPGTSHAVSFAKMADVGFQKITSAFGWKEHGQYAVLEV